MTNRKAKVSPLTPLQRLIGHYDAGIRTFRAGIILGALLPLLPLALLVRFSGLPFDGPHHFISSLVIGATGFVLYFGFLESLREAPSRIRFLEQWRGWAILPGRGRRA